ncbi:MAG: hypothetical protein LBI05_08320 [Planctomycetaceae bacterium]|nr:hypothetical protein [Planctomycetaceae bacterium]
MPTNEEVLGDGKLIGKTVGEIARVFEEVSGMHIRDMSYTCPCPMFSRLCQDDCCVRIQIECPPLRKPPASPPPAPAKPSTSGSV